MLFHHIGTSDKLAICPLLKNALYRHFAKKNNKQIKQNARCNCRYSNFNWWNKRNRFVHTVYTGYRCLNPDQKLARYVLLAINIFYSIKSCCDHLFTHWHLCTMAEYYVFSPTVNEQLIIPNTTHEELSCVISFDLTMINRYPVIESP